MEMKVFICEPEYPTHYHFIQFLLPSLAENFDEVYVGVAVDADSNAHFVDTIKPLESLPHVTVLKVFEEPMLQPHEQGFELQEELVRTRNFELIERISVEKGVQQVVALTGDKLIPLIEKSWSADPDSHWQRIAVHLGVHWLYLPLRGTDEGASPRASQGYGLQDIVNEHQRGKLQSLINIKPKSILVQNYLAYEKLRNISGIPASNCIHLPVPIQLFSQINRRDARVQLGLPNHGFFVGFTGSIQRRKGIKLFLQAVEEIPDNLDIKAVLIGPFEHAIESLISTSHRNLVECGKLILRNQVLDPLQQHVAISALDVVVCNLHEHHWSSDIALRSIVAERPILASDGDWFRYMIKNFGIGKTISAPGDHKSVARAIRSMVEEFRNYVPLEAVQHVKDFNRTENFTDTALNVILGNSGASRKNGLIEWPAPD